MHPAVRDDRIWFQNNPAEVVRFRGGFWRVSSCRQSRRGTDLASLVYRTEAPPAELRLWTSCVCRSRTSGQKRTNGTFTRIPALRSKGQQNLAERVKRAIASGLLASLEAETETVAA